MSLTIAISILLLQSVSPTPRESQDVQIVYHFGYGAQNKLDTMRGTFTKDMISSPDTTITLYLTHGERMAILDKAEEIGFFEMQKREPPEIGCLGRKPCQSFYLEIHSGDREHCFSWDNCKSAENDELKELRGVIGSIIASKPEVKALPRPRGGYR